MREKVLFLFCIWISQTVAIQQSWTPIVPVQISSTILHQETVPYGSAAANEEEEDSNYSSSHLLSPEHRDQCALYKVGMNQQLYFEYIQYKVDMPDLKEFTLCLWNKFTNHSNDHPLFSYAVGDQARGMMYWVANSQRSSYFMLNVDGHNLYRLNYPLRLNKWYHSCTSWNGRTGEWQIWVNDERVGRGYNNHLVGHVIKGGGIAITGQEQRQLGGGFLEGEEAPKGSGGLLGEVTMLQLYNVALTAGKAHKDHKHHHVHHFEHDHGNREPPATTTQAPVTGPPLPMHPLLTGGQINHRVKINPGAHLQIIQNGVTLRHPLLPPAPESFQQPLPPANRLPVMTATAVPQINPYLATYRGQIYAPKFFPGNRLPQIQDHLNPLSLPVNGFNFVDRRYRDLFKVKKVIIKRHNDEASVGEEKKRSKRDSEEKKETKKDSKKEDKKEDKKVDKKENEEERTKRDSEPIDKVKFIDTREEEKVELEDIETAATGDERTKIRRGIFQLSDGSLVDDSYLAPQTLETDYFNGLTSFGSEPTAPVKKEEEREPAEAEVRLVMDVCDGCSLEPFPKALVLGWRTTAKKLYSGALHLPAVPLCKSF